MKIRWTVLAIADLVDVRAYVAAQNRAAARRLASRIRSSIRLLQKHPALGRPGRVPGTRELVIVGTPLIAAYRVRQEALEILRVLHAARRWPRRL